MNPTDFSTQYRPTWLDLPISYFSYDQQRNTFTRAPSQQTTLRTIATTSDHKPLIEQVRDETDAAKQKELKNQLPAISPVSLMYHRRANTSFAQKIKQQWPLLMGDIDQKENPGVDMAELKRHLSRLSYVMLCAFSVRGGIWFVIRLPDHQTPDTLAAHFRYLQKIFREKFGVELDKSKGGNPTDLRFVSYDAAPYLNDSPTVMGKTYTPPKPAPVSFDYSHFQGRSDAELLTRLVRRVEGTDEGNRHSKLLKESRLAGGYIAAGRMDEQAALYALETVSSEWPNHAKSQRTIRDGIRDGKNAPIYAEERPGSDRLKKVQKPQCRYVRTFADWLANPGTILRPDESQLTRLTVETADHYPPEWDMPTDASEVPTIRVMQYQPANAYAPA